MNDHERMRALEARVDALEKDAHEPVDFTALIARVEMLEEALRLAQKDH